MGMSMMTITITKQKARKKTIKKAAHFWQPF
jgi:hypothetical protein